MANSTTKTTSAVLMMFQTCFAAFGMCIFLFLHKLGQSVSRMKMNCSNHYGIY